MGSTVILNSSLFNSAQVGDDRYEISIVQESESHWTLTSDNFFPPVFNAPVSLDTSCVALVLSSVSVANIPMAHTPNGVSFASSLYQGLVVHILCLGAATGCTVPGTG